MNAAWSKPLANSIQTGVPALLENRARSRDVLHRNAQSHKQKTRKRRQVKRRGKVVGEHTLPILPRGREWLKSETIWRKAAHPGAMSTTGHTTDTVHVARRISTIQRHHTARAVPHSATRSNSISRGEVKWPDCH
jgi:hypothetical protein